MKVASVVGARPQFIKMAAVSRAVAEHNQELGPGQQLRELIIHTGQHYDYGLSRVFFDELHIPEPKYNLNVGSASPGVQTGEMLKRVERTLSDEQPDLVLVYGDTNSTLAGALAAAKLHIPVAHVEAGLRSYRKSMPEEINRVLTDHVATILFCPTEQSAGNLVQEGEGTAFADGKLIGSEEIAQIQAATYSMDRPLIVNVGDVMYDHLLHCLPHAEQGSKILAQMDLTTAEYFLVTIHRASNTDNLENLNSILTALHQLASEGVRVIFPVHPRTRKALTQLDCSKLGSCLSIIDPVSYYDMLMLEKNARLILTDSGGVQKEAFFLQVPCITLREETEWRETVDAGWNTLAGTDPNCILDAVARFEEVPPGQTPPEIFGNGRAAEYITNILVGLG